jgi:predicted secreted protein
MYERQTPTRERDYLGTAMGRSSTVKTGAEDQVEVWEEREELRVASTRLRARSINRPTI